MTSIKNSRATSDGELDLRTEESVRLRRSTSQMPWIDKAGPTAVILMNSIRRLDPSTHRLHPSTLNPCPADSTKWTLAGVPVP